MTTRADVISYARTMIGTPYHHQGRVVGSGIDCIGAIIVPLQHFGIYDQDIVGYSRLPQVDQIYGFLQTAIQEDRIFTVDKSERIPGDIMLLRIRKDPQHFAWVTDVGMLHAQYALDKRISAVVEHSMNQQLIDSIIQVYRIRGLS